MWGINIHYWKPISDCYKWSPEAVSLPIGLISAGLVFFPLILCLGLFYLLPDHVFGVYKYKITPNQPQTHTLLTSFPYGVVRHPAATFFLWFYWCLPAYSENHIFLASLWTVFIVVGTLVLEESGLRTEDEFGKKYLEYAKNVPALYPNYFWIFSSKKKAEEKKQ